MNLNDLAKEITLVEGKKKQVSIAQVKEILKIIINDREFGLEIAKRVIKKL